MQPRHINQNNSLLLLPNEMDFDVGVTRGWRMKGILHCEASDHLARPPCKMIAQLHMKVGILLLVLAAGAENDTGRCVEEAEPPAWRLFIHLWLIFCTRDLFLKLKGVLRVKSYLKGHSGLT